MRSVLHIDPEDNVLVALRNLKVNEPVPFKHGPIGLKQDVPRKHKFLIKSINKGEKVNMYGVPVGTALTDLEVGEMITTENIKHYAKPTNLRSFDYQWQAPDVSRWQDRSFMGYHRDNGQVGTANYWIFVPLVFCENRNLRVIEDALKRSLGYHRPNNYEAYVNSILGSAVESAKSKSDRYFENVDGIKFLYHHGGCGGTREDSELLLRLLAGYVHHPNVAGATVLSLGCQHAQIKWFEEIQKELYPNSDKPVFYLEQQQVKSEEKLIKTAIDMTLKGLAIANKVERNPASLSNLVIGLECGGSDGFSGISANPAVGHASDLVVALGGTTMLSEFPELNGVEQNLVDRCTNLDAAEKFLNLQKAYEKSAERVGSGFDMNPSPGNIKDGLITDAIKSAGAATKGGKAPVSGVLDYAEPLNTKGLHLLCTPGSDVESTTGLTGSGATVSLFTTGLGTPTGNPITPMIKISTNTELHESMNDIIDLNAGTIIRGEASIQEVGEEILEEIIAVASGKPTKAMLLDQDDFIPWKRGISL